MHYLLPECRSFRREGAKTVVPRVGRPGPSASPTFGSGPHDGGLHVRGERDMGTVYGQSSRSDLPNSIYRLRGPGARWPFLRVPLPGGNRDGGRTHDAGRRGQANRRGIGLGLRVPHRLREKPNLASDRSGEVVSPRFPHPSSVVVTSRVAQPRTTLSSFLKVAPMTTTARLIFCPSRFVGQWLDPRGRIPTPLRIRDAAMDSILAYFDFFRACAGLTRESGPIETFFSGCRV